MRRSVPVIALVVVLLASLPASARQLTRDASLAKVRFIYGGLTVQPPKQKARRGKPKMPLYNRYFLSTQHSEKASVRFRDGTTLYLNQNTDAVLRDPHLTVVKRGEVDQFDVKPGATHRIQTATAIATAIGTNFDVRVQGKTTTLIVAAGKVAVGNGRGRVTVKANQETVVPPNAPPSKPGPVDAAAAIGWTHPLTGADWTILAGPNTLGTPQRLATDSAGNIYVTDSKGNRVVKLSPAGKQITTWGGSGQGDGQFGAIAGIAIDGQNNVYVVDAGYSRIEKFSSDGRFLTKFGGAGFATPGSFDGPEDVALDAAGNIYVADSALCRIQKLSPTGDPLGVWGEHTACDDKPGHFDIPSGVGVDSHGNVVVADSINNRIVKLSPSGATLAVWGNRGSAPGQFYGPNDIAFDAHDNVYVADPGNYRLQKLSPAGKPLMTWGDVLTNSASTFDSAYGVATDRQGNLFVVDRSYLRELPGGAR